MLRPSFFRLASAVALVVLAAFIVMNAQMSALRYDKGSEVKIKGVIDEVRMIPDKDNTVHIMLKNEKGLLDVTIAPEKFLKEVEITFAKGENVEILGSQLTVEGNPVLLAREVNRNGSVMMMRDEQGKPLWLGWPK